VQQASPEIGAAPAEAPPALLELREVHVRYGAVPALRAVSLEVREGEIVALLGANGAGKTTTLRTVSGLVHPTRGDVVFAGREISQTPAHDIVSLGICHVPEGRRIFPQMSVIENLEMGAYRRSGSEAVEVERVFDLFLDEPSMGLAPLVVDAIFGIIGEIRSAGTTILLVEQNAAQALQLSDRGYVMENGAVVMAGPAADLLSDDRVRAAYLGQAVS
jgi:branched-chain amino acid transport system ATP-binding protein